jgi:hypothetical protein
MSEIALDVFLLLMLGATTIWCVLVHRRLGRVAIGQAELADFVGTLVDATGKAEHAARELRDAGLDAANRTREQGEATTRSSEELARLLATAARVNQRLETSLTEGLRTLATARTAAAAEPATPVPAQTPRAAAGRRSPRARPATASAGSRAGRARQDADLGVAS